MDKKVCIITGIRGQDASILAEQLLAKDYKVYGLKRRSSSNDLGCSSHLERDIEIFEGDLLDLSSLLKLCQLARANEFYNLAGQSHVHTSFEQPIYTGECTGLGALNCLEAIRMSGIHTRFLQASSSEMYGGISGKVLLDEQTPLHPRSPYGCAKAYAHYITQNYRESYRLFACSSICFNHEAPGKRGPNFVTRKITLGIRAIKEGKIKKIQLGNLEAMRDWSHAADMTRGMWMMLNHTQPEDFVLASGVTNTVRYFCKVAFEHSGLGSYEPYIEVNPLFYRPAEVDILLGNATKAQTILGWKPEYTFEDLVKGMVDADLR